MSLPSKQWLGSQTPTCARLSRCCPLMAGAAAKVVKPLGMDLMAELYRWDSRLSIANIQHTCDAVLYVHLKGCKTSLL